MNFLKSIIAISCDFYSYKGFTLVKFKKAHNNTEWVVIPKKVKVSSLSVDDFLRLTSYKEKSDAKEQILIMSVKGLREVINVLKYDCEID